MMASVHYALFLLLSCGSLLKAFPNGGHVRLSPIFPGSASVEDLTDELSNESVTTSEEDSAEDSVLRSGVVQPFGVLRNAMPADVIVLDQQDIDSVMGQYEEPDRFRYEEPFPQVRFDQSQIRGIYGNEVYDNEVIVLDPADITSVISQSDQQGLPSLRLDPVGFGGPPLGGPFPAEFPRHFIQRDFDDDFGLVPDRSLEYFPVQVGFPRIEDPFGFGHRLRMRSEVIEPIPNDQAVDVSANEIGLDPAAGPVAVQPEAVPGEDIALDPNQAETADAAPPEPVIETAAQAVQNDPVNSPQEDPNVTADETAAFPEVDLAKPLDQAQQDTPQ